jgi:hypothetical protein
MNTNSEVRSGAKGKSPALTTGQVVAAEALLAARPPVYDGTRVVADREACKRWYDDVTAAIAAHRVPRELVNRFCDIAGVPD